MPLVFRPTILALALLPALASPAAAVELGLAASTLEIQLWTGTVVSTAQSPDPILVSVADATGAFALPTSLFATAETLPSALFTGVPLISAIKVTFTNQVGSFGPAAGPGGGFGGAMPLTGGIPIRFVGGCCFFGPIGLSPVGQGGMNLDGGAATLMLTLTGAPWSTGAAVVTGVSFSTPSGAIANTASRTGFDARTPGLAGTLQLVTPIRILSNIGLDVPLFGVQTLHFVPEPSMPLLFGVATLAVWWARRLGRR